MKKLILPMFLFFFAFSTVNATNSDPKVKEVKSEITNIYKVSTFCKLIQMGNYDAVKALIIAGEDVNKTSNGFNNNSVQLHVFSLMNGKENICFALLRTNFGNAKNACFYKVRGLSAIFAISPASYVYFGTSTSEK